METGACDSVSSKELQLYVIAATLISVLLVARWLLSRQGKSLGVGLQLAYLGSFWMSHWVGAAANALPWYCGSAQQNTALGARESLVGLVAFAAASLSLSFLLRKRLAGNGLRIAQHDSVPRIVFYTGAACYVLSTPLGRVPSLGAVVSGGQNLALGGICLLIFQAWTANNKIAASRWLVVAACIPVLTVVSRGFIGYGIAALMAILCFVVYNSPRQQLRRFVLLSPVILYAGLSVYVTYMRDRDKVRESVWGSSAVSARLDQVVSTFSEFELFSPYESKHLDSIDLRLNQNALVGAAVVYAGQSTQRANGETIINAFLAMIPRIVWPNKPVVGGSGDLVTRYTGITFADGTSVGIGQVLEFYINFGTASVAVGFALFAAILAVLDLRARTALDQADSVGFAGFYVLGMAFQQLGGSLMEVAASAAASLVIITALRSTLRGQAKRRAARALPALAS